MQLFYDYCVENGIDDADVNVEDWLELSEPLIAETAQIFETAVNNAFKTEIDTTPTTELINKLTQDVWLFSGCKTYTQLREASKLLKDENNEIKPFYLFKRDVAEINAKYNGAYLQAEYNSAVHASQSAAKWNRFQQAGDRYYLQYRATLDGLTRDDHEALDRITLPIDDPFWLRFFTPNGWNCRCNVIQVLKSKYKLSNPKKALIAGEKATEGNNKIFQFNPGAQGIVFPEHHPYRKKNEKRLKLIERATEKRFITKKEKYIKNKFNIKDVSLEDLSIEATNSIVSALDKIWKYYKVDINKINTSKTFDDAAEAHIPNKTITFNPKKINKSKELQDLIDMFGENYYVKTKLNPIEYIVAHEVGHLYFSGNDLIGRNDNLINEYVDIIFDYIDNVKTGEVDFISERAKNGSEPNEFAAECFVMQCFAEKKSKYSTDLFNFISKL